MFKRWPEAAGYAAATWSAGYALLGVTWLLGWNTFPWGRAAEDPLDPGDDRDFLVLLQAADAAPAAIALGAAGAVVGLAMARGFTHARWPLAGFGAAAAVLLAVIAPDGRALMVLGYLPMLIGGLPFGWPPVDLGGCSRGRCVTSSSSWPAGCCGAWPRSPTSGAAVARAPTVAARRAGRVPSCCGGAGSPPTRARRSRCCMP
ncbi:hypothetical protein ACIBHY_26250 [Nonomuraea sp. NPDC050547]|uniref:hypothetical protein n=1 Tax=Nonomuraea sp. NPDC050547 TaxID=3364368 RepID=UPI003793CC27